MYHMIQMFKKKIHLMLLQRFLFINEMRGIEWAHKRHYGCKTMMTIQVSVEEFYLQSSLMNGNELFILHNGTCAGFFEGGRATRGLLSIK